jgi:uncharacterized protein with gpF-like domain
MAFRASKKRERKPPEPVSKGTALIPSVPIRLWYQSQLLDITEAMLEDYRRQLSSGLRDDTVRRAFATDATAASILTAVLSRLWSKWTDVFAGFAGVTAKEFVRKSDEHTKATVWASLSTAGVNEPTTAYNENINNTLNAEQTFNNTLIRGIHQDVHEKIFSAVMLSLTSPNPEEQGQSGIENVLKKTGEFAHNRVKLIAQDQTSKLYSSLSDERMRQNNVEEFEWLHSSAGKEPRASHVKMDSHIFKLDDPRLWQVGGEFDLKKGDLGPPGWAIKCRCRKRPIIM